MGGGGGSKESYTVIHNLFFLLLVKVFDKSSPPPTFNLLSTPLFCMEIMHTSIQKYRKMPLFIT